MKKLILAVLLMLGTSAYAQPRQREILNERPSGFWTSNRPATGGAYKWRLLGVGTIVAGSMGLLMFRVLRRANASRARNDRPRS